MKKIFYFCVIGLITLSGCTKTSRVDYIVGTDAAYAPFEYQNADNKIVGFEIDLFNAIAEKSKFTVQFINTPWEGIFNMLANGDRDILVSAITITDERKQTMDFSNPYFESKQFILTNIKSNATSLKDFSNKKMGVQSATTADVLLQKIMGKSNPNIKRFESLPLALKELETGGIDAAMIDSGAAINYIKNNKSSFKIIEDKSLPKEYYGIAVRKGNTALLSKINEALDLIKKDGTYDKIYQQYFNSTQ